MQRLNPGTRDCSMCGDDLAGEPVRAHTHRGCREARKRRTLAQVHAAIRSSGVLLDAYELAHYISLADRRSDDLCDWIRRAGRWKQPPNRRSVKKRLDRALAQIRATGARYKVSRVPIAGGTYCVYSMGWEGRAIVERALAREERRAAS